MVCELNFVFCLLVLIELVLILFLKCERGRLCVVILRGGLRIGWKGV